MLRLTWGALWPQDYWRMEDDKLEALAKECHIPGWAMNKDGQATGVDRVLIIDNLLKRLNSVRASVSFLSMLVTLSLTLINLYLVLHR